MARKRSISPMIWEDPTFNSLSIGARLLFVGMFSNADDEGYIRGDTGSLKRLVFGFDDTLEELPDWIAEIQAMKNVHFYEVAGEKYAHFLNWHKHQKQQKDRIVPSNYPPCNKCLASAKQVRPLSKVKLSKVKLSKVKLSKDNIASPEGSATFVRTVQNYFTERYEAKFGSKPAISFGKDGKVLKAAEGLFKSDVEKAKRLVDAFLESEKAVEVGYDLSIAFSTHTINQWQAGKLKSSKSKVHHL